MATFAPPRAIPSACTQIAWGQVWQLRCIGINSRLFQIWRFFVAKANMVWVGTKLNWAVDFNASSWTWFSSIGITSIVRYGLNSFSLWMFENVENRLRLTCACPLAANQPWLIIRPSSAQNSQTLARQKVEIGVGQNIYFWLFTNILRCCHSRLSKKLVLRT